MKNTERTKRKHSYRGIATIPPTATSATIPPPETIAAIATIPPIATVAATSSRNGFIY